MSKEDYSSVLGFTIHFRFYFDTFFPFLFRKQVVSQGCTVTLQQSQASFTWTGPVLINITVNSTTLPPLCPSGEAVSIYVWHIYPETVWLSIADRTLQKVCGGYESTTVIASAQLSRMSGNVTVNVLPFIQDKVSGARHFPRAKESPFARYSLSLSSINPLPFLHPSPSLPPSIPFLLPSLSCIHPFPPSILFLLPSLSSFHPLPPSFPFLLPSLSSFHPPPFIPLLPSIFSILPHPLSYNSQLMSTNDSILSVASGVVTAHNPGTTWLQLNNTTHTTSNITVVDNDLGVPELDPLPLLYQLTASADPLPSSPSQSTLTVELLTELFVGEQVEVTASLLPSDGHRVAVDPSHLSLAGTTPAGAANVTGRNITGTSNGNASINVSTQCGDTTLSALLVVNITDPPAPAFQPDKANATVFENVSIGASIFATYTSLSNAKFVHRISYSLPGGSQTFSVDSNTGVVRVIGLLDYTSVPSYTFNIKGTDYRGRDGLLQVGLALVHNINNVFTILFHFPPSHSHPSPSLANRKFSGGEQGTRLSDTAVSPSDQKCRSRILRHGSSDTQLLLQPCRDCFGYQHPGGLWPGQAGLFHFEYN